MIALPDSTLDRAIMLLACQTGVDIVSTETGLGQIRVGGVHGNMSVRRALDRLLAGSPFQAMATDASGYRIVRRPVRPAPRLSVANAAPKTDSGLIVVTASKRMSPFFRFSGSVSIITLDGPDGANPAHARSLNDVANIIPVLQRTELGSGRNKVFIRGVADSSFNGPTQSTASVYLGDIQLGYSGPDPDLRLYDIQKVEIMEGPQGTLYGTGAIGGVIRVTPNPVDLSRDHVAMAGGFTATRGGAMGHDLDGMFNLVLLPDRLGVRAVAYRVRDGGFIDDLGRGLANVNHALTQGGRITVKVDNEDGWTIEGGALVQDINAADSQYADGGPGTLSRRSTFAQPFRSNFSLGRMIVTKLWDNGLQLVSASGLVDHHSKDVFDATRNPASSEPTIYQDDGINRLITQEVRLSRTSSNGDSYLIGMTFLHDRDAQSRLLGPVGDPQDIIGVTNRTRSLSAFAEGTLALTPALSVTAGGRLTKARTDGEPSTATRLNDFVRGRSTTRLDPTVALSWVVAPRLATYARYQTGFRTGGLAIARGIGRVADFRPDAIDVVETGIRFQPDNPRRPSISADLSFTHWTNIQADLVDRRGLPYTANIGNARIVALESSGRWSPSPGLEASVVMLYTFNKVSGPLADLSRRRNRRLAETPAFAGTARLGYHWLPDPRDQFDIAASIQYVGRSVLGTGDYFDISQGRYAVLGVSGGWTHDRYRLSLIVDNLSNRADNRFSLGNPFLLATRSQSTPIRPTSIRVNLGVGW